MQIPTKQRTEFQTLTAAPSGGSGIVTAWPRPYASEPNPKKKNCTGYSAGVNEIDYLKYVFLLFLFFWSLHFHKTRKAKVH